MANKDKAETSPAPAGKREKLPPKGKAARLRRAVGLWSHMTPEEIEHIRREIYGSRKSAR